MKIFNPTIELLAIKLYEHDHELGWYPRNAGSTKSWMRLPEVEREEYRKIARGGVELPDNSE
jgi:hypothetical protein